jgi:hypothetical protein
MAALFCLAPLSLAAAEDRPALAESWEFTIKQGHLSQFLAAIKEHGELRMKHGDTRDWEIFTAMLGDGLNKVAIRYCCFNWADADAYDRWQSENPEVMEHWFSAADQHVEKSEHYFEQMDWGNSHWNEGDYRFFAVTAFQVKPGQEAVYDAARDKMSQIAINQGWATEDRSWIWATRIGGAAAEYIVIPHENYASMGGGGNFSRFLADKLGSEESAAELLQSFASSTRGSSFQIWEHHPQFSAPRPE